MKNVVEDGRHISDTFCSGLARVEKLGADNFRLTFAVSCVPLGEMSAEPENIVNAKLIIPREAMKALADAIEASVTFTGPGLLPTEPPNETLN